MNEQTKTAINKIKRSISSQIGFIKSHDLYPKHGLSAKVEGLELSIKVIESYEEKDPCYKKMKGSEFITMIQDGEIGSSSINIDDIKDEDEIELVCDRMIYRNGDFLGYYHYI